MSKITNNIINYIRSYSRYDLKRELLAWLKIIKFYLPVAIPIVAAATAVFIYIKPIPLTKTYLAIGQGGGMYEQMASTYQAFFATQRLDLEPVKTDGLESGLKQAHDEASRVDSSFITSGTASAKQFPGLVSLGSVEAAPLWLFYRGQPIHVDDPFEYFSQRKIAVGTEHTVTHRMFSTLMELNNPGTGERNNFLRLAHSDAADKLRRGEIDAMFIVDGFHSSLIQSLLNDPEIHLMNFTLADAYVRKLPYLQKVTIPKASINLSETIPVNEITLLATSVNLLVESTLHPAVQWAFLMAAQDRNLKTQRFFTTIGPYPAYQDKSFPLSPVAERFYKSGIPSYFSHLPLWLAALIENFWVLLLAIFLIAVPFIKKLSGLRSGASEKLLWKHFWELRHLEDLLGNAKTSVETTEVVQKLQALEYSVSICWVGASHMRHYYNLKRCVSSSLQDAKQQLKRQQEANL